MNDADRLALAFVERDAPGVHVDEDWNVMGQRATVSGSAVFDHVRVDPELVIPYQQAFEGPQQMGARAQLVHTAIQVGIAGGALHDAREFIRTRARPFFEAARAGSAGTYAERLMAAGREAVHTLGRRGAVQAVHQEYPGLASPSAREAKARKRVPHHAGLPGETPRRC